MFINFQYLWYFLLWLLEAVAWGFSIKKVFLTIFQNSLEHACTRASRLVKLQVVALQSYLKRGCGIDVFFCLRKSFL